MIKNYIYILKLVLNNQNDKKLETDELTTDLISAIKEFEETTAKIALTHQNQEEKHQQAIDDIPIVNRTDEKGPIDYFNRTKESLRHVEPDINNNNDEIKSNTNGNDELELDDQYVKIPVQQLINTFEKQMRSIIKQKINENIQVKMDDITNKISSNNHYDLFGTENDQTINVTNDFESIFTQHQFDRTQHSIEEQWSKQIECTTSNTVQQQSHEGNNIEIERIISHETQPDNKFYGGKANIKQI